MKIFGGSLVKKNIVANLFGGVVVTILTLVITPLQIDILGIQSYGVIGFIATLQVAFSIFDLGLSSTLTRELAIDKTPNKSNCHKLIGTVGAVYWMVAIVIGSLLWIFSESISQWWFKSEDIGQDTLIFSFKVIGLYLGLRWPVSMYIGILSGLQRMDALNAIKIAVTITRLGGGLIILLFWKTLDAFLIWIAFSAFLELWCYWFACKKIIPKITLYGNFSFNEIKRIWKYSLGINILSITGILIIQMDRIFLSKMGSLEELGYYNLAYVAVSGIGLILGAINSAAFPWLSESFHHKDRTEFLSRYNKSSLAILLIVGLFSAVMIFYSHLVISLWVNEVTSNHSYLLLIILAAGSWISASIANLYNVAIASGRPSWHIKVNGILILPYFICLYIAIKYFGAIGAALSWLFLNITYVIFLVNPINVEILGLNAKKWLTNIFYPALITGILAFLPLKLLAFYLEFSQFKQFLVMVISSLIYVFIGYFVVKTYSNEDLLKDFFLHYKIK